MCPRMQREQEIGLQTKLDHAKGHFGGPLWTYSPDFSFPRKNSKLEENHCVSEAGKKDPGLGALKLEMHFKGS